MELQMGGLYRASNWMPLIYSVNRKKLSLNQKNKGAAIEKPLFVDQGCLDMSSPLPLLAYLLITYSYSIHHVNGFAIDNYATII